MITPVMPIVSVPRFITNSIGSTDSGSRIRPQINQYRPQNAVVFSETYGESAASSRADVGIGPYRVSANSHCPTNTHHKRKKEST